MSFSGLEREVADTKLILSSPTSVTTIRDYMDEETPFRVAKELEIDGLELLPTRFNRTERITGIAEHYEGEGVTVEGIHYPLRWETQSLKDFIMREEGLLKKLYAVTTSLAIGKGSKTSAPWRNPAPQIAEEFSDSYILIHPDVFKHISTDELTGRVVYFEPGGPKRGEGEIMYNPDLIRSEWIDTNTTAWAEANLMFDPGHLQMAQEQGKLPPEGIHTSYRRLKPKGIHFSFSKGDKEHALPDEETWAGLRDAIQEHPPRYLVLEVFPGEKMSNLEAAREMVYKDLGL